MYLCDVLLQYVSWNKATECDLNAYREDIASSLSNITDLSSVQCNNVLCKEHDNDINILCTKIINACTDAADRNIPHSVMSGCMHKNVPGWEEHVKPYRNKSIFWHGIWLDNERPKHGIVWEIMRRTRAQYHSQVRWVKQNTRYIQSQKMAQSVLKGNTKDFWAEVKRIRGHRSNITASMDGEVEDKAIANLFANKYSTLYNSVAYDSDEMCDIKQQLVADISKENVKISITVDEVRTAMRSMKIGKSDGKCVLMSDHIINGGHCLNVYLSMLFNCMVMHGVSAASLGAAVLVPIPKDKRKSLSTSDNYRAIALSSPICKLFDIILINKYRGLLNTCELQCGFKQNGSTNMCTFMVKETIQYYLHNGSNVHAALLDATKAFDRINFCKLFRELINRKIPALIMRLLIGMYTNQSMTVRWNGHYSASFGVSNGVKQGGVLSPILFCIYMDNLLVSLKNNGVGCHVGSEFCGAFGYADDIILMSPSVNGLQTMLNCCSEFACKYNVIFNPSKSKSIIFSKKGLRHYPDLYMNAIKLDNVQSVNHLGHILNCDLSDDKDVTNQIHMYNRKANSILAEFKYISGDLRVQVMQGFCSSYYGSQLWNLSNKCLEKLYSSWRKSIRKALNIPLRTHSVYIPLLCKCLPLSVQLELRYVKFFMQGLRSKNSTFCFMTRQSSIHIESTGSNCKHILHKYNLSCSSMHKCTYTAIYKTIVTTSSQLVGAHDRACASIMDECIQIRDRSMLCDVISSHNASEIVNCLAVA